MAHVVLAGASAGGHLAALLVQRMLREGVRPPIQGMLLFYPALDPKDSTQHTVRLPFSLPPLGVRTGMSALDARQVEPVEHLFLKEQHHMFHHVHPK